MPRPVSPERVARLQRRYLRVLGASAQEVQAYAPILKRQIGAESGFRTNLGSPAGARDVAQFIPSTARQYGVTLGDNKIRDDIRGQVRLMLPLLRKHGVEGALRGYNAGEGNIAASKGFSETNAYVKRILGGSSPGRVPSGGGSQPGGVQVPGVAGAQGVPQGSEGLVALLTALGEQTPQRPSGSLAAPAHSAQAAMPVGAQIPQGGGGPAPAPSVADLLEQVRTVGGDVQMAPGNAGGFVGVPGRGEVSVSSRGGRVVVDPNADRAGARTHDYVVQALRRVSAISGHPLRLGTGTRHSRLTVNGKVSDHWSGDAGDVPATGKRLIELGQAALIDAGMPEKEARKQTGGLYNVHGAQIIFNTQEGGDHTDHLHYHPRRRR
jgi:hypothetical protein